MIILNDKIEKVNMEDTRVSVRLSPEEHRKFKIFATNNKLKMQEILKQYILKIISEDTKCQEK